MVNSVDLGHWHVYYIVDKKTDKVVYIGCTTFPLMRMKNHQYKRYLATDFHFIVIGEPIVTEHEALIIESEHIYYHRRTVDNKMYFEFNDDGSKSRVQV